MIDYRRILEDDLGRVGGAGFTFEDVKRRRDRKRRNQRITAGVVGIGVFVASIWIVTSGLLFHHTGTPAAPGTSPTAQPSPTASVSGIGPVPDTDYLVDLNTGEMTPLPESILGANNDAGEYAASPDGTRLAYTAPGDNGKPQIFVANLDGTAIEQVTHDLDEATSPAWSPDGSKIAYIGWHDTLHKADGLRDVFVLDLASGASTQLTFATREPDPAKLDWSPWKAFSPSFTADGSGIVYGASRGDASAVHDEHETRIVPVDGGESMTFMAAPYSVLLSPDGTHVSYGCGWGDVSICVANVDGTDERVLVPLEGDAINGGAWSPDGTRIASWEFHSNNVSVVDVASGQARHVAEGYFPAWLDDHTLIVEMDRCYDHVTGARVLQGCGG